MQSEKEQAKKLIEALPDGATWDDIMYQFYVKKKLAAALQAAANDDVVSHQNAKERLLAR